MNRLVTSSAIGIVTIIALVIVLAHRNYLVPVNVPMALFGVLDAAIFGCGVAAAAVTFLLYDE